MRLSGRWRLLFGAALSFAAVPQIAFGAGPDAHAVYEQRCAGCHQPHASDLARASLALDGDVVRLKAGGMPLAGFLANHPRRAPTADEQRALIELFAGMLKTGFLYQRKCVVCHDRASQLARLRLKLDGDRVVGRYSGHDTATFLAEHGRLEAAERDVIVAMLRRQLGSR
ncbi:MAG: hypothetical protein AB7E80_11135 [Hyphomicrobiaceae bacterium]